MATSAKSHGLAESRAVLSRASNCRWVNPRVGDSGGTEGRRMCSAGERSTLSPDLSAYLSAVAEKANAVGRR